MPRKPRSPRAVQVKGGRWMRPPRPRLIARPGPFFLHRDEGDKVQDSKENDDSMGYDTCEENVKGDITAGLVASAQPVIEFLAIRDMGAAKIVAALCRRLEKKEELVKELRSGVNRDEAQARAQAQVNCQGQSARHWWQVKKLKGRVDFAMQENSLLRRRLWENYHYYVPYEHPP